MNMDMDNPPPYYCLYCRGVFKSANDMNLHYSVDSHKSLCRNAGVSLECYRCNICLNCFDNNVQIQRHINGHRKCPVTFTNNYAGSIRIEKTQEDIEQDEEEEEEGVGFGVDRFEQDIIVDKVPPYRCTHCYEDPKVRKNFVFGSPEGLSYHYYNSLHEFVWGSWATWVRFLRGRYRCNVCHNLFDTNRQIQWHINRNHTFLVTFTDLYPGDEEEKEEHRISLNSEEEDADDIIMDNVPPYRCFHCEKIFSSEDDLSDHYDNHKHVLRSSKNEGRVLRGRYRCDVCLNQFDSSRKMQWHMNRNHTFLVTFTDLYPGEEEEEEEEEEEDESEDEEKEEDDESEEEDYDDKSEEEEEEEEEEEKKEQGQHEMDSKKANEDEDEKVEEGKLGGHQENCNKASDYEDEKVERKDQNQKQQGEQQEKDEKSEDKGGHEEDSEKAKEDAKVERQDQNQIQNQGNGDSRIKRRKADDESAIDA